MRIYDVRGRLVATLVDGLTDAGRNAVTWDAATRPAASTSASSRPGDVAETRKMTLLK